VGRATPPCSPISSECWSRAANLLLGFFAGNDRCRRNSTAKVTCAYRWPPDSLAELLRQAGFVEVARLLREPRQDERFQQAQLLVRRPPGALIAPLGRHRRLVHLSCDEMITHPPPRAAKLATIDAAVRPLSRTGRDRPWPERTRRACASRHRGTTAGRYVQAERARPGAPYTIRVMSV
jgi:hypothetical protein